MRLIDADALQEKLTKKKPGPANARYTEGFNDALLRFKSMIHAAPTIEPQTQRTGRWIPVSERLPEVAHSVLFSRRSMDTSEGCLQADGKWWQYRWNEILNADQVTAWKPMPEPYREEDTDVNVKS